MAIRIDFVAWNAQLEAARATGQLNFGWHEFNDEGWSSEMQIQINVYEKVYMEDDEDG